MLISLRGKDHTVGSQWEWTGWHRISPQQMLAVVVTEGGELSVETAGWMSGLRGNRSGWETHVILCMASCKHKKGIWVWFCRKLIGYCYRDDVIKAGLNEAYTILTCIAWLIKSVYWLFSWFWHIPKSSILKGIRCLILFCAEIPLLGGKDYFILNFSSIYRLAQVSYFLVNLAIAVCESP